MRVSVFVSTIALVIALPCAVPIAARAQSALNINVLRGLTPFGELLATEDGTAALAANLTITASVQSGAAVRPGLQAFDAQCAQALRDAFITSGNASELADGLGTKLAAAYQARARYASDDDGATSTFTSISQNVADVFAYSSGLSAADAASAKFFFANGTVVSGGVASPAAPAATAMLSAADGTTDVYGKAYRDAAGSAGADTAGDSRPFQTEASYVTFPGVDYFGVASSNDKYLKGPTQTLTESPSFPSGHTTYGFTESLLLAIFVPERYAQMIVRGAEYGNGRILMGAHYAMDVIAGRTLAYYDVAHMLANAPGYGAGDFGKTSLADYAASLARAKADVRDALQAGCGGTVATCALADTGRFSDAEHDAAFYEATQTYGLPVVYEPLSNVVEDFAKVAPEAGYLLTAAFPALTLAQADAILTQTEGAGGGFLDSGAPFGAYSRIDLYRASLVASGTGSAL